MYSPCCNSEIAPPPIQPPVSSRLRTLVRAETLPSPYCACSGPGPLVLVEGKASTSSTQTSGRIAPAISRARANAGCSRCSGAASINRAATPATVGEAMLVPFFATYSPRLPPPRAE